MSREIGNNAVIVTLFGVGSAIVDNVPLVAASIGMFSLETYPIDHAVWDYLAYCAGTGEVYLLSVQRRGLPLWEWRRLILFGASKR